MTAHTQVCWCVTCGERDPDTQEVCPVSELWMRSTSGGLGLRHLIAYGVFEGALRCWKGAAEWREKAGLGDRAVPDG